MRSVFHSSLLPLVSLCLTPLGASMAEASNTPEPRELDQINIVSNPLEETHKTRSTEVTGPQMLRQLQPNSVAAAVKHHPNVTTSGGSRANNQTVSIRGLEANRILQTVDGVRQVFESGHRPSFLLDPSLLREVEVVKGPSSSIWGSGALGGVVAQRTLNAWDLLEPQETVGGFIKTGFNTNNDESNTVLTLAGQTNQFDWLFGSYYRDSNNLEMGNGLELDHSGSQDIGVLAKGHWYIDTDQTLRFSYRAANDNGAVPSNGAANPSTSNPLIDRKQKTHNVLIGYNIDSESPWVNADVSTYWNRVKMHEARISDSRLDRTELDVFGFNINNLSQLDTLQLRYGIDGYQEQFSATRSGGNRPNPPDGDTTVWGSFVQGTLALTPQWKLELGGRYDHFKTQADTIGSRSDSAFSPSAALIWQASDELAFTLRHDRAFRSPSSEELYTTGTHYCIPPAGCETFKPNPDLASEKSANTELNIALNLDNMSHGGQLGIRASLFENRVDNFIEQVSTSRFSYFPSFAFIPGNATYINVDEAKLSGFEIAADYRYQQFLATASYGMTRGKDQKTGDDLTNIPADTLKADLSYAFNNGWRAGVRLTHALANKRTWDGSDGQGRVYDGYTLTDLYASWNSPSIDGLSLDITLNNISNRYYRVAWSELYEPGREVIASLRYDF